MTVFIQKHKWPVLYRAFLLVVLAVAAALPLPASAQDIKSIDRSAAVIFAYQRVGEEPGQLGNLSLEQFQTHLKQIKTGGYTVLPLAEIADALAAKKDLPPRTIALTFDGAWAETLKNVAPLLKNENLPYTVFVIPDMATDAASGHAGWADILSLLKSNKKVSLGLLPNGYRRLSGLDATGLAAVINTSTAQFREATGASPLFFAYPYGEYSTAVRRAVAGRGFKAVFGLQSGVASSVGALDIVPRFTMTDTFGNLDRFDMTANALPLPVSEIMPEDPVITQNPPLIGFSLSPQLGKPARISCFVSGQSDAVTRQVDDNRIEIRPSKPLEDRITRVNCTMPAPIAEAGDKQVWRWFGMILVNPQVVEDKAEDGEDDPAGQP